MATNTIKNFGLNVSFQPENIFRPQSAEEVLELMLQHSGKEIRAIGSLHAWSDAQKTDGVVFELKDLNSVKVDRETRTVSVGAGCQVKRLVEHLGQNQLALPSLGLIDEQTVAGATATGTHGSGKNSLSHYIQSVTIAHYSPTTGQPILTEVDSGVELEAARCSLGLMGVIVELKFQFRNQYNIEEHAQAHASLESVMAAEESYPQQQFYMLPWSWKFLGHHRVETKANRSRLAGLYRLYCFLVIDVGLHIAIFVLAKLLRWRWPIKAFYGWILPLTIVRKWKVVDDSHKMLVMEHELFRHIEIELFVQRSKVNEATEFLVDVLSKFGDSHHQIHESTVSMLERCESWEQLKHLSGGYTHHYPICYRRILPDDTLISMTCPGTIPNEDWFAISLISYQWPSDRKGFYEFANFIGPVFAELFEGRCHWGKYNPLDKATNEQLYPRLGEFREVVRAFDADNVFQNDWFNDVV